MSTSQMGTPVDEGISAPIVLILVGRIASGKSTFAKALEEHLPHRFRRCNQDDLGNRRKVESLARDTLRESKSPCIDRTNFYASQRSHWINIAREFSGTLVWVIVFDTPYEVCAARLRERTFHPTIKTPEDGLRVLASLEPIFKLPSSQEGYNHIIYITPAQHMAPTWTSAELGAVLKRLENSPPVNPQPALETFWSRGHPPSRVRRGASYPHRPQGSLPALGSSMSERGRDTVYRGWAARRDIPGSSSDSATWRSSGI